MKKQITKVYQEDMNIVWLKLGKGALISVTISIILGLINFLSTADIPVKYTLFATLIMAVLQAILKAIQEYKQ